MKSRCPIGVAEKDISKHTNLSRTEYALIAGAGSGGFVSNDVNLENRGFEDAGSLGAWNIQMSMINAREANAESHFPNYPFGMDSPEGAETLIAKDGNNCIAMPLGKNNKE